MRKTAAVISLFVATALLGSISAQTQPIFSIGSKNGLHTEFAQNRAAGHEVLYKVGREFRGKRLARLPARLVRFHCWPQHHATRLD